MGALSKVQALLAGKGPKEGAKALSEKLRGALTRDREAILLAVDLTDPKNRLRPKDQGMPISPLGAEVGGALLEVLSRDAPAEVERVRTRIRQAVPGLVAWDQGVPIGYVFWVPGSHGAAPIHPDLPWLGLRPATDEVYLFDYFLTERARGKGALFVRATQERHFQLGYRRAYGYVYADNTPALWLYRTTGWKEIGRVKERRYLEKVVLVDGRPYWMEAHHRWPLLKSPGAASVRRG